MMLVDLYKIPAPVSLAVVTGILGLAFAASFLKRRRDGAAAGLSAPVGGAGPDSVRAPLFISLGDELEEEVVPIPEGLEPQLHPTSDVLEMA